MARYSRGYEARYDRLKRVGFLDFEADTIAGGYSTFRGVPYIRKMAESRRWTVMNLLRRKYSPDGIEAFILNKYKQNDWLTNGEPDVWKMLRAYRDKAIADEEYFPRKRGKRTKSIGKGDVKAQRARASYKRREKAGKATLSDYEQGRGKGW